MDTKEKEKKGKRGRPIGSVYIDSTTFFCDAVDAYEELSEVEEYKGKVKQMDVAEFLEISKSTFPGISETMKLTGMTYAEMQDNSVCK